jgi:hypothetical protein
MRRVLLGWFLMLHGIAHAFVGLWSSTDGSMWAVSVLWAIACVAYMTSGLGILRVPRLRHVWKQALVVATAASIAFTAWYLPPWGAPGLVIDMIAFLVTLSVLQPRIDADIDVADTLGDDAFAHPRMEHTAWTLGLVALAYVGAVLVMRPVSMRWGSTLDERYMALPGDEVHPLHANYRIDHAITIHAPASAVWPWLVQLGQDRGGFYSYDWLERAAGVRIHNASVVRPEWQARALGDTIFATQRDYFIGKLGGVGWRVNAFEPERVIGLESWGTFVVRPIDSNTTRLIVRTRGAAEPNGMAFVLAPANVFLFEPMHFIMERGMLRGIRDRAERSSGQPARLGTTG